MDEQAAFITLTLVLALLAQVRKRLLDLKLRLEYERVSCEVRHQLLRG